MSLLLDLSLCRSFLCSFNWSFLCSLFSSWFSSSKCSSLLLSYLLCNSFVCLLLSSDTSLVCSLLVSSQLAFRSSGFLILLCLPSIKLSLTSSFIECALLHTTEEVLHHVNAFA